MRSNIIHTGQTTSDQNERFVDIKVDRRTVIKSGMLLTAIFNSTRTLSAELTKFTEAVFQSEIYLPNFVLKEEKIAEGFGLSYSTVTPQSGSDAAQLLVGGAVSGWCTDPMIIFNGFLKTGLLKSIGLCGDFGYTILVSKSGKWPNSNAPILERVKSLKGKKIGVSGIGAGTDNVLRLLLHEAGLSDKDVTRLGIGQQTAAIGQFLGGGIDAFVSFSLAGNYMIEKETGAFPLLTTMEKGQPPLIENLPMFGLAMSTEFYQKNRKTADSWVEALGASVRWIQQHRETAAKILNADVLGNRDIALAQRMVDSMLDNGIYKKFDLTFKFPKMKFDALLRAAQILGLYDGKRTVTYEEFVLPPARG